MGVIYGASLAKTPSNGSNFDFPAVGKNSEVFTAGDCVTVSSGFLKVAGSTDQILGVVQKTVTMASDNQTVAQVKPAIVPTDQDYQFLMGTNIDMNATQVGNYIKLNDTALTGVQQLDQATLNSAPTSLQFLIEAVDPFSEGGTGSGSGLRKVLVKIVDVFNIKSKT